MRPDFGFMTKKISAASFLAQNMSQSKYRIKAVWLSLHGRQLCQNAYFLHAKCQNVTQIFTDLWLKNEVGDVPADHF